ncbi:LacI family DNA-binding transcriptional regulator [Clostridium sp. KNHs205]|uniref:LacI family DNA-binding transcriptional regulator n=1 Tax=Clostridium sp. KNHs205 TaxID=1449050 RepID=UPI00051B5B08|nr:LacI family DNA-binding transcriptional regulator [Clostridium sp. KNHs205]
MRHKVTVQDIADALNISRNTVSKAINGTGVVSKDTQNKIYRKAAELGYKQFSMLNQGSTETTNPQPNYEIALFSHSVLSTSHFSSALLHTFQEHISALGYRLSVYTIRDDFMFKCQLPANFNYDFTKGIIIIEMFNECYTEFLCNLEIPTLFIDTFANTAGQMINSDIMYMENYNCSYKMTQSLLASGYKKIGFVGDYLHCHSFYERWSGYRKAMQDSCLDNNEYCILENDNLPYYNPELLASKIKALPCLPDAFVCANDYIAIDVIRALKSMNLIIPNDIKICGFDNSAESRIIEPPLTTANIPGDSMGYFAAETLLSRIQHPELSYRTIYVQTQIINRLSTSE